MGLCRDWQTLQGRSTDRSLSFTVHQLSSSRCAEESVQAEYQAVVEERTKYLEEKSKCDEVLEARVRPLAQRMPWGEVQHRSLPA